MVELNDIKRINNYERRSPKNLRRVRIHIDETPRHSPNPTTGAALYAIGQVRPGFELYREVSEDREDTPVPNDATVVHLKEDEHFHSAERKPKEFKIIVNGTEHTVAHDVVTFDQLTEIAFPRSSTPIRTSSSR